jgi:DNA polymerase III delta subunit
VSEPLAHLYLIAGSDRPKVLRAVARLRARVEREGGLEDVLEATDASGAEVAGMSAQLGLLAAHRLVVVQGVEAWRADDVAALEAYAAAAPPATTVALVAGEGLRKDHRVRALVPEKLQLLFEAPTGRGLFDHVRREAERLGASLEPDALRRLIQVVGEHPMTLERELDKLATFAAGETIDVDLVDALAVRGGGVSPFALTDAVSTRDRRTVFRALARAEDAGEKPHALLPQVARHVELLRRARAHRDAGGDVRSFAKAERIHEFRARKLFEAADAWPARDAARAAVALARADHAMKGGQRIDPELALELALARSV